MKAIRLAVEDKYDAPSPSKLLNRLNTEGLRGGDLRKRLKLHEMQDSTLALSAEYRPLLRSMPRASEGRPPPPPRGVWKRLIPQQLRKKSAERYESKEVEVVVFSCRCELPCGALKRSDLRVKRSVLRSG